MNVLITAIGSLAAEAVLLSLRENGHLIHGCDIYPSDWLFTAALVDRFYQIPKAFEPNYINTLQKIIKENTIDLVIPLTDPEVDVISQNRSVFENLNTKICIPDTQTVENCRNKSNYKNVFTNIYSIPILKWEEIKNKVFAFDIIAKPKRGRSSEGIFFIKSGDKVQSSKSDIDNYIFQKMIKGSIFTVDLIRDNFGNIVTIPRKELLRTVNGAGITVEVASNDEISSLAQNIALKLNLIGCINIEFIFDGEKYFLLDINPRFSAGIGFTLLAGYDLVKNHIKAHLNQEIDSYNYKEKQIMAKRYIDFIINKQK